MPTLAEMLGELGARNPNSPGADKARAKLLADLRKLDLSPGARGVYPIIKDAENDEFSDLNNDKYAMPKIMLVNMLQALVLTREAATFRNEMVQRVIKGEYDEEP